MPVGRHHSAVGKAEAIDRGQQQGDPAGQGEIGAAVPQAADRQVHRHQRTGAGGVDREGRTQQPQGLGQPARRHREAGGRRDVHVVVRIRDLGPELPPGVVRGAEAQEDAAGVPRSCSADSAALLTRSAAMAGSSRSATSQATTLRLQTSITR